MKTKIITTTTETDANGKFNIEFVALTITSFQKHRTTCFLVIGLQQM
jgi:hypothetical protein